MHISRIGVIINGRERVREPRLVCNLYVIDCGGNGSLISGNDSSVCYPASILDRFLIWQLMTLTKSQKRFGLNYLNLLVTFF